MSADNTAGELGEIIGKLKEGGLDAESTDQEKVIHLWRLYTKSETNLKVALATVTELQQQQAEEMKEFENYVEHVRKLSAEREALTVEFAAENDQLKAENDQLRQELESFKSDETRDMLLQQGLDEIADGTISEQIAYLLVERARLMDELEAEEHRHLVETPEGLLSAEQLQKQLEHERLDFESELRQQRETMNHSIEALKSSHEEEISTLVAENQHLQAMLNDVKSQLTSDAPALKSPKEYNIADANHNMDLSYWEKHAKELEKASWDYKKEIEQLQLELQREKTRSKEQLDQYEETLRKLREERNHQKEYINELQIKNQKLNAEKKSSDLKMNFMEKELEDLREQERNRVNKQKSVLSCDENTEMNIEIHTLRKQKEDLEEKLENMKALLLKEKQSAVELEDQLKQSEGEQRAINAKVKVLESQVIYLEEKLEDTKQNQDHQTDIMSSGTNKLVLEQVITEKNDLEQELIKQRHENTMLQLEIDAMKKHVQRLEAVITRQEKENDELMKKLHESRNDYEQLERALLEERDKYKDSGSHPLLRLYEKIQENNVEKESELNAAHSKMEKVQLELSKVTSELRNKENHIAQLQLALEIQKTKTEQIKEVGEKQVASLQEQLEQALIENQRLKLDIEEKMKLLETLREDIAKLRAADVTLESSVPESDMSWFDKDAKKLLIQNKPEEFYKKIAELEAKNDELRKELDETRLTLANAREELAIIKGERSGETFTAQSHSGATETTLFSLQQELMEAKLKLEYAERDLKEMASIKEQLLQKQEEIMQLQNQLQEEKFNRSLAGIGSDEINNQLMATRQREQELQQKNTELQLKLLDAESKLQAVNKQTESDNKEYDNSEQSRKSLTEQVAFLTKENDLLQHELVTLSEKYDQQLSRYNERRNKTKNKLQKARDVFNTERAKLRGEVEKLQKELSLTKLTLEKELEWKDSIDNKYHALLLEKHDLLYQLTEQDEVVRDHRRQLAVLQVRSKFLEEENNTLQQRMESLIRQKQNLDRMIKDYQFERHKEQLHRIVSLSAMTLISPQSRSQSCDFLPSFKGGESNEFSLNHSLDALISPRFNSPAEEYKKRYNRTLPDVEEMMEHDSNVRHSKNTDAANDEQIVTIQKSDTVTQ